MPGYGHEMRREIYREAGIPVTARFPVSYDEWKTQARGILPIGIFDYIAGGAGGEYTIRANREAFYFWRLLPRVLVDIAERDLSIDLFGYKYRAPIMLAPVDRQELYHTEGELATARAAAAAGIPFVLSTFATRSIEEVAVVMGNAPRWFQLYFGRDRDVVASMIRRAEAAGYLAIVVTVDRPVHGWRERELRNLYPPVIFNRAVANFITDPVFLAKLSKPPQQDMQAVLDLIAHIAHNPSLTWNDIDFVRSQTKLPVLVKGVLCPGESQLALKHGASGIIVSNHGGRHLDGALASLNALPGVVDAVNGRAPVLMDSGIRRGADVVKAYALGASAVLVGRPYVYGLAVAGEAGVVRVVRNLLADTDLTMANIGAKTVKEINRSMIVYAKQ